MTTKLTKRLVREGDFVAEVDVYLVEEEGGWSPYLSLEDAGKLDAVRRGAARGRHHARCPTRNPPLPAHAGRSVSAPDQLFERWPGCAKPDDDVAQHAPIAGPYAASHRVQALAQ